MAIKVHNNTVQVIPLIIPIQDQSGGIQVNVQPKGTVILGISEQTEQIKQLVKLGKIRVRN